MTKQEVTENVIGNEEIVAGPVQNIIDKLYKEHEENKLCWTDLKVGDVITNGCDIAMITRIDGGSELYSHIFAGNWISDNTLCDWEKVQEETSE